MGRTVCEGWVVRFVKGWSYRVNTRSPDCFAGHQPGRPTVAAEAVRRARVIVTDSLSRKLDDRLTDLAAGQAGTESNVNPHFRIDPLTDTYKYCYKTHFLLQFLPLFA